MRAENMNIQSYPWYLQDWFVSDTRARLTLEERALYREVIDLLYHHGGFLDDDADILQRKVGCKEKEFLRAWPRVKACFDVAEDGRLCHPKVLETLSKIATFKSAKSEAGRKGALSKHHGKGLANSWQKPGTATVLPLAKSGLLLPNTTNSVTEGLPEQDGMDHQSEFLARWNRWPKSRRTREVLCQQKWCEIFMPLGLHEAQDLLRQIDSGIDRWLNSRQFAKDNGQWAFGFADFLAQRRWNEQPEQIEAAPDEPFDNEEIELHWQECQRLSRQGMNMGRAEEQARKMIYDRRRNAKAAAR